MELRATESVAHSISLAPSGGSQKNVTMGTNVYYQPQYPIPRPVLKHYFGGRKDVEGRGRSFVMNGILQIFFGLLCFVLALIALSITMRGNAYNAGTISGLVFIATGVFGCMVGSSMSDCYAMTYLVLNIVSVCAAVLGIGVSSWEVNNIGSMTSVASSDGYLAVKCSLVMISCFLMLIVCIKQARKLRHTPCCRRESENELMGQKGPLDCVVPPSNTTTNSSWHWNLQHNVNQPQSQRAPQDPNLPMAYLANIEAAEKYSPEEIKQSSSYDAQKI